jgi:negative regulator of sigma E activity
LLDGELERDQVRFLLRGVAVQSDLVRRWTNYQLIGASLKHDYVAVALLANFADGVLGRLDASLPAAAAATSNTSRRIGFAALRWAGGGAIAAAVAVVALTTSRPQIDQPAGGALGNATTASRAQAAQPYLPFARPQPNANPLLFDYGAMRPASYEQIFLPGYDKEPKPARINDYHIPYDLMRAQPAQESARATTTTAVQP